MSEGLLVFPSALTDLLNLPQYNPANLNCNVNAILYTLLFGTEINLVALVAIERYLLIIHDIVLKERYYYLILAGFFAINISSCMVSLHFDGFSLHPTGVYCLFNLNNFGGKLGISIVAVSVLSAQVIIYYCYIRIMFTRRSAMLKIRDWCPSKYDEITKQANNTIFRASLVILTSTITTIPYCILTIIGLANPSFFTIIVDFIMTILILLNIIMNTLLLLIMRADILEKLKYKLTGISSIQFGPNASGEDIRLSYMT
ncbi:hypothetical protein CONCODRAFT_9259 [Conidiobolus coronatus NRRL 28638]|uniref:G-protein coupled receptors family 1 profile domain-containing protein n=1 Tax=Conidiobolus coronatus (strain ATCC 28846 / CBS 209.66 / NRRL 28638) TaxID=796925 RepID=A0A137P0P3_CONC2|nr:hypothetical protein CONCODRAFT_9259 [Conidiobolus coronatus NRRL 28638]|eukprot:KXN68461.1 hypothetical protein CONCODRAFT_9259 [Conidiobolus coronatus NRRL 28638]